ncbi:AAA domain-containing protein [Polyangium sp. 15x6]|uniref:AAA domain-containing protein n=1 Tax=Polyangium sp. 15x6 TaxID=3042687 RepID=UPI00249A195D|nr:AAA domain-containing protein [Polyangium sp. 15x6]MDI3284244.1 AAA domain-containing protein [Polyangium sp. 15x6]
MLTHRIIRYAASQGLALPALQGPFRVGLAGTLRIDVEIPLALTDRARSVLAEVGVSADALLNAGDVVAAVQLRDHRGQAPLDPLVTQGTGAVPEGYALLLEASGFLFILKPAQGCFLVVHAAQAQRATSTHGLLLIARYRVATVPSFDPAAVLRQVAVQLRLRRVMPDLSREHEADRTFLLRYRRYLEALRDHGQQVRPEARYQLVSRVPLRLVVEGERWPAAFGRPRTRIEIPTHAGKLRYVEVAGLDDEQAVLSTEEGDPEEEVLDQGTARIADSMAPIRRMLEALAALAEGQHDAYLRLLDVLRRPDALPDLRPSGASFPRLGAPNAENMRQHEAVAMALDCTDLCLVHGPPGTGKTTVICEIVRQLVAKGQRILLVAPTNVALDNVLERIGKERGIVAIRLGDPEKVSDDRLLEFVVHRREASLRAQLARELDQSLAGADPRDAVVTVQQAFRDEIAGANGLGDLLLLNANLVCATPIGIAMTRAFRDPEPVFDVMIMDEAGKATLTELLVPATRAKRWVLVGDHLQLAPYVDIDELTAVARMRAERADGEGRSELALEPGRMKYVAGMLRRQFEERMHPDEARKQKVFRDLLEGVFDESDEVLDGLSRGPANADRFRDMARQYAEGGVLPDELVDMSLQEPGLFASRARLLAELLEMQDVAMTSAFEFLQRLPRSRSVRLNWQHRMFPELAAFSGRCVYTDEDGYHSGADTRRLVMPIPSLEKPSIWIDTAFCPPADRYEYPRNTDWVGGNYSNPLEVDIAVEAVEHCIAWAERSFREDHRGQTRALEIGVVSFYFEQARQLRDALARLLARPPNEPGRPRWRGQALRRTASGAPIELHVSVVDRFQGQEKDIMVISGTRSNPKGIRGHVNNFNRMNVAATRGRYKRIFIGDTSTLVHRRNGMRPDGDLLVELFKSSEHKQGWGQRIAGKGRGGAR